MLDFIINAVIWVLALYGLIEIIKTIYYICTCTNLESDGIYFIIAVKNQEEKLKDLCVLYYLEYYMVKKIV